MSGFCPKIQRFFYRSLTKSSNSPFFKSSSRGFTLIELLVVIAIIGLLTGGAIAAYNNFNRGQVVKRAALELKSDLRESQNRAISGVKHEDCREDLYDDSGGPFPSPADNVDDYNLRGHYVAFTTAANDEYRRAQVCSPDPSQGTPIGDRTRGTETINFPGTVTLAPANSVILTESDGFTDCGAISSGNLTINFKSLRDIEFYDGTDLTGMRIIDPTCVRAQITITDGATNYEVEVDKSGQIVENEL